MSVSGIFLIGLFVSSLTLTAAVLVGLQEASDPALSRLDDLTEIEKKIVGRPAETAKRDSQRPATAASGSGQASKQPV